MSEPSKAVFLSDASQDAEVARRICQALQARGIEVWSEQSELRGGDARDQKICRQIKDCALFIPIISSRTQARAGGDSDRHLTCSSRGTSSLRPYQIAQFYAWRVDKQQAFDWLERAYQRHDGGLADLKEHLLMGLLAGDARYAALLRKVNLPQRQQRLARRPHAMRARDHFSC